MNTELVAGIIDDYLGLVSSKHYEDYILRNPAGTSWSEYRNEFKQNVVNDLKGKNLEEIVNLLVKSGAINSPVLPDKETSKLALDWHLSRVSKNHEIKNFFPSIEEANFVGGNGICTLHDGRRFSLDTFRYLAYVEKIQSKLLHIESCDTYAELGSGNGGFARVIKLINPKAKCYLIDLPEVLFCSRAFLIQCFPDSKHVFVSSFEVLKDTVISDADFVYLSHSLFAELANLDIQIDLFCNMRSIGEMPMHATKEYRQILEQINVSNIFLENRFLNPYSLLHRKLLQFRKDEITGSTWMQNNWHTVDFDLEPAWTKSPFEADHPRYLSLCLSSEPGPDKNPFNQEDEVLSSIQKQVWFSKYHDLRPYNLAFKAISIDRTTLQQLWEINRKNPTESSLRLMIDFIAYHFGTLAVEEIDYYQWILRSKFNSVHLPISRFNYGIAIKRVLRAIKNQVQKKISGKHSNQVTEDYR